ncbi:tetratricopeptide repeat protein [Algiphilus sp.]|uniref:tetratricopeptide repeat protein n=1 Tax=Algiphilus sp. TaxID=1872431 RepID=UPI0032EF7685
MNKAIPASALLAMLLVGCGSGDAPQPSAAAEGEAIASESTDAGGASLADANRRCRELIDRAQRTEAQTLCLEALERAAEAGEDTVAYGRAVANSAYLFQMNGDYEQAVDFYERAIEVQSPRVDTEPRPLARTLADYGLMAIQRGDAEAALPRLERAAELLQRAGDGDSEAMAALMGDTAEAHEVAGDMDAAVAWYERSLAAYRKAQGESHANVGIAMNNLGMAFHQKKEYAKADPLLRDAYALLEAQLGAEHPVSDVARRNISDNAAMMESPAKAPAPKAEAANGDAD